MKNTPFTNKHIALGAKMAEFAGYNMPISYTGINDEHAAVRKNAGVFDVSHMGEFILKGENALILFNVLLPTMLQNLQMEKHSIVVCQMKMPVSLMTCLFIVLKKIKCTCWW